MFAEFLVYLLKRIWIFSLIAMGFVLILTNGCKKNDDINNPTTLVIGQSYQGGIIAYILQPGDPGYNANVQHGLIAASSDQSTGIQWYNGSYTVTGATATALGTCQKDYIYMGNKLIAEHQPVTATKYYYASDQIKSTLIVTNSSGTVVYSALFDPYGGMLK